MKDVLSRILFGNALADYLLALSILVVGLLLVHLVRKQVLGRLKRWAARTETTLDDALIRAVERSLVPAGYLGVLYLALRVLEFSPRFARAVDVAAVVATTALVVAAVVSAVNYGLSTLVRDAGDPERSAKQLRGIRSLVDILIWGLAAVFLLDNLGVKISAVVAGLGIGGVAVALAAQAVLGDLFSYFVIFFDKPFELGDFIVVGDKMGTVEQVGIKTTRLRALGGEQLVSSNTDLTNSRLHNFKKMQRRRIAFTLGVVYQTTAEKLRGIPALVQAAIEQAGAIYDRGHFASFGDFSLNFEFVYFVDSADYTAYMDTQQAINLAVFAAFEREGIEFAFPSQTLYLSRAA